MSDPVNPAAPPRQVADDNIVRRRSTNPHLTVPLPDGSPTPPPAATPTSPAAPSLLGLPGQAMPAMPDFDAPTVAQEIPVGFHVRIETQGRSTPGAPGSGDGIFDVEPATIVDTATPRPPPPPPIPSMTAPPPPPPTPLMTPPPPVLAIGDGLDFGETDTVAPAIRPAIEAPEFTSGGRPRPVRERRATAPAMPVPVVDSEASGSGRVRPPVALDPPVEPSTPRARPPVALDPPVEPSTPRLRPGALDPPLEPSSGRVPRPTAPDPDAPPARVRSRADADAPAQPEASGARARPTPPTKPLPLGPIGAVVVTVVVALLVFTGGRRGEHRYSQVEERRLADLWLESGAREWGGVRQDAVARAVDNVGAVVARAMSGDLEGRTPRFVVINDEVGAQAFTLPDATVVVTTGALRRLGSEAQLAALLAHGLGHVEDVAAHLDRAVEVEPAVRQALGGGPPGPAVALVTAAATATYQAPRELDVDAMALDALAAAELAPGALADVLRNFGIRGGRRRSAWLSQHPDDPARVAAIEKAEADGRTGETEYATRVLDLIGRHGPVAPTASPAQPTTAAPEKKSTLRTLPTAPPTAPPTTPTAPAQRLVPPDEAPPAP